MQDLVSYKHKHNEENGENNRDGHGDNRSDSYGVERETENLLVVATREKQKRNSNRIFWSRVDGTLMEHDDWNRLSSVALHLGVGKDGDELIYLINQTNAPARFTLPSDRDQSWVTICDTNLRNVNPGHAEDDILLSPTSMAILHYSLDKIDLI